MKRFNLSIRATIMATGILAAMSFTALQSYAKGSSMVHPGTESPAIDNPVQNNDLLPSATVDPTENKIFGPEEPLELNVQLINELQGLITERVKDKDPNKADNSSENIIIEPVTDLTMLSTEVMGRNRPEELYDLRPLEITLAPAPTDGTISVSLRLKQDFPASISLVAENGKVISTAKVLNATNLETESLKCGNLAPGTYYVEVKQGSRNYYQKVTLNTRFRKV